MAVSGPMRRMVRERASLRCEYCGMAEAWEPFFIYHIQHIIARQHGSTDGPENLAPACNHCNLLKGPNLTSIDPATGNLIPLFNPRKECWLEHFVKNGDCVIGRTHTARTTAFFGMRVSRKERLF